jgi:hypothetical protein
MNKLFETHLLNAEGIAKARSIAQSFDGLLSLLEQTIGLSGTSTREFSIVKSKLEEASFYAKKSMAQLIENQKQD